jgi:CMP-N-acetylneuraminic acid synthetase
MNIALIPARGGSERIKNKNIKKFNKKPLIYWICKSVEESILFDVGYVSTDSEKIKNTVLGFGFKKIKIINRCKEASTNYATAHHVILDFLNNIDYKFSYLAYLNPTSPFFTYQYLDASLKELIKSTKDSQLCVVKQNRFQWHETGYPKNYKIFNRPRTQDMKADLIEVGACYIQTYNNLIKFKDILGGVINLIELPEYFYFELDNPLEWTIMSTINRKLGLLK